MLSVNQIDKYHATGYLMLPEYFSCQEVDTLRAQLPGLLAHEGEAKRKELDEATARTVYGVTELCELYSLLARTERVVSVAEALLGEEARIFQAKVNFKMPFGGSGFEWHQDFSFWHSRDGMPEARVINFVVFLDDVDEFNAPIFVCPGSHHLGLLPTSKHALSRGQIKDVVERYGIASTFGRRGTVLLFGGLLIHASPPNISPFNRTMLFLTYNAASNYLAGGSKESRDYFANRSSDRIVRCDERAVWRTAAPYESRFQDLRSITPV